MFGRYANETSSTSKYLKIAALLPDKTVRDVALRCHWLSVSHLYTSSRPSDLKNRSEADEITSSASLIQVTLFSLCQSGSNTFDPSFGASKLQSCHSLCVQEFLISFTRSMGAMSALTRSFSLAVMSETQFCNLQKNEDAKRKVEEQNAAKKLKDKKVVPSCSNSLFLSS